MAAAESLPHYEAEARKRMSKGGDPAVRKGSEKIQYPQMATEQAGKDFKVNPHYIADAKALREAGFLSGKGKATPGGIVAYGGTSQRTIVEKERMMTLTEKIKAVEEPARIINLQLA